MMPAGGLCCRAMNNNRTPNRIPSDNRRNPAGRLTTPAQVVAALRMDTTSPGLIHAMAFVTHCMAEYGCDLTPAHLAGCIRENAVRRLEFAAADSNVPMAKEAAAFLSTLPR